MTPLLRDLLTLAAAGLLVAGVAFGFIVLALWLGPGTVQVQ